MAGRDGDCRRKVRYPTKQAARHVLGKCEAERGTPLSMYECLYCGGWHLCRAHFLHGAK